MTVGLFINLDNVSSSRSWSPEKWRLVHNRSRSAQTFRSCNQLISNYLKDFILDNIQTINFLPSRLYYIILSRSRSPKRRHQDKSASSLLFFFWTRQNASKREGGTANQRETRNDWYILRTVLVYLCHYFFYLQCYSIILMASLALFSFYRQYWSMVGHLLQNYACPQSPLGQATFGDTTFLPRVRTPSKSHATSTLNSSCKTAKTLSWQLCFQSHTTLLWYVTRLSSLTHGSHAWHRLSSLLGNGWQRLKTGIKMGSRWN